MKKMSWLSIEKNIKWEKMPDYNYKNVFYLENFVSL